MELVDEKFRRLDEYYRRAVEGHVYIRETLEAFYETVGARIARLPSRPRILELGSHAGFITESILQRWPEADIVVNDENVELLEMARKRLAERDVRFERGPLGASSGAFDLVVSVARHHHLPYGYLSNVHRVLKADGVYVLADELCPEYCGAAALERIAAAEVLELAGGYVFTSRADWLAFERSGTVPLYARELEDCRRRSLWHWYRFVVDCAVERGYFDIAGGELQSAMDDFVTGSKAEHKFSPAIVEREFELARLRRLTKRVIGSPDDATRQGMFVYELGRG